VSALWTGLTGWQSPEPVGARSEAPRTLRPVPAASPRLARRPFAVVICTGFRTLRSMICGWMLAGMSTM